MVLQHGILLLLFGAGGAGGTRGEHRIMITVLFHRIIVVLSLLYHRIIAYIDQH